MKTVGIVAEYNPLHNGHQYHIQKSRELSQGDFVIAVMSGNYVQRGEPAILDKWHRTRMALQSGVDMVIELPVLFSCASAEFFASAAIKLLQDTGLVNYICFGSEIGDVQALKQAADFFANEPEEFQLMLKQFLDEGLSYPTARMKAFESLSGFPSTILSNPNNILGIEYLKALSRLASPMLPITVERQGAGYHSSNTNTSFASATALRKVLFRQQWEEVATHVPPSCLDILQQAFSKGQAPISMDDYVPCLQYHMRMTPLNHLGEIFEVSEGLEHRILRLASCGSSIEEMISAIKTKRYTYTKVQRILLHILLDISSQQVMSLHQQSHLPYIRVLGFRRSKEILLKQLIKSAKVPVITNLKNAEEKLSTEGISLLQLEEKATDIYFMVSPNPCFRKLGQERTTPMVMIP